MEPSLPQEPQEEQLQAVPNDKKKKYILVLVGIICLILVFAWLSSLFSKYMEVVNLVSITPTPEAEVSVVTQAPMEKKEVVDERPIGSLPYSYISGVGGQSLWVEKGFPTSNLTLRTFESLDNCLRLDINDAGPLNKPLELYLSETYQLPNPINAESFYKTQYVIPGYKSITIGPMGAGEVSHTAIQVNGRIISADVWAGKTPSAPECITPETDQAQTIIQSIQF
jgi:hypothetical protein